MTRDLTTVQFDLQGIVVRLTWLRSTVERGTRSLVCYMSVFNRYPLRRVGLFSTGGRQSLGDRIGLELWVVDPDLLDVFKDFLDLGIKLHHSTRILNDFHYLTVSESSKYLLLPLNRKDP